MLVKGGEFRGQRSQWLHLGFRAKRLDLDRSFGLHDALIRLCAAGDADGAAAVAWDTFHSLPTEL